MPTTATSTTRPSDQLSGRLGCPRCEAPLDGYTCGSCQLTFPVHDGVPWLVADPDACRSEWKNRWQMALKDLEQRQRAAREALGAATEPAAQRRLANLADGYASQHRALKLLLKDLGLAAGADLETYLALKTRLPSQMGLMAYEANVFRDWVWGDAENGASLAAVSAAVTGSSNTVEPLSLLVLGAGAGRLAWDLHQSVQPRLTVAVELNPYLTTLMQQLAGGRSIDLVEFPLAPIAGDRSAIPRTLAAPEPAAPGFEVLLADVMRPPFVQHAFDVVITPWLLDVLEGDTGVLLTHINRLLKPGGRWVYHGSLAFQRADPAENINLEELEALASATGFEVQTSAEATQAYLDCPDSRHGRRESVITCTATKISEAGSAPRQQAVPDWIAADREPIPLLPAFQSQAMTTRVHAFIMSLIDGKRTLEDMAEVLEDQRLMPRDDAKTAIRGFLIKMYDEARSGRGL